jgi:hypothetical protein
MYRRGCWTQRGHLTCATRSNVSHTRSWRRQPVSRRHVRRHRQTKRRGPSPVGEGYVSLQRPPTTGGVERLHLKLTVPGSVQVLLHGAQRNSTPLREAADFEHAVLEAPSVINLHTQRPKDLSHQIAENRSLSRSESCEIPQSLRVVSLDEPHRAASTGQSVDGTTANSFNAGSPTRITRRRSPSTRSASHALARPGLPGHEVRVPAEIRSSDPLCLINTLSAWAQAC